MTAPLDRSAACLAALGFRVATLELPGPWALVGLGPLGVVVLAVLEGDAPLPHTRPGGFPPGTAFVAHRWRDGAEVPEVAVL